MYRLQPPKVRFGADGTLSSDDYQDRYFSSAGGLDEARYVYIDGNGLPHRWRGRRQFAIAEIGFGSGLNFLATWQAWANDPAACDYLDYIAVEQHPLDSTQARRVLAAWPELSDIRELFLHTYPNAVGGFHRRVFGAGRLRLSLLYGDAVAMLTELDAQVDAWYLDGFAPSRNPDLWSQPLLDSIGAHSTAGATLSSYSVAGVVRRHLDAAGFSVRRRPGFGRKRAMLTATLTAAAGPSPTPPWYLRPQPRSSPPQQATVIGAGIAGCCVAFALAQRGYQVTLIDREAEPATAASGIGAALLAPPLSGADGAYGRFYLAAYLHCLALLERLASVNLDPRPSGQGVMQLAVDEREWRRQRQRLEWAGLPTTVVRQLDRGQAIEHCGIDVPRGGLWYGGGGWLRPKSLCQALLAAAAVPIRYVAADIVSLRPEPGGWRLLRSGPKPGLYAERVIVANGLHARQFVPQLPLTAARGQTSALVATPASRRLRAAISYRGYVTPAANGWHIIGATLQRGRHDNRPVPADDLANVDLLASQLQVFAAGSTVQSDHVGLRATTPDRLPLVGAVPDFAAYRRRYADLARGRPDRHYSPGEYLPGLYLACGFGARGVVGAALAAELLAALIDGSPLPIERGLSEALHPARFLIRELRRGRSVTES